MRIPDNVLQCVAYLGAEIGRTEDNATVNMSISGTGFFVVVREPGINFVYLITARHVIERMPRDKLVVRLTHTNGTAAIRALPVDWHFHPDPSVDVAAIPFAPDSDIVFTGVEESMLLPSGGLNERGIGIGNAIFVVGLFARFFGSGKNHPFVHSGHIAMIPDEPLPTDRGAMEAYIIESHSVAGISGSPVFVRETRSLFGALATGPFHCLGLVHGHYYLSEGKDVGLGAVIVAPSHKVLECIRQESLVRQRREVAAQRASDSGA